MAEVQTRQNPEALHDVGLGTEKMVSDNFVNPGIPSTPLVTRDQMTQATIKGSGTEALRACIINK